MKQFLRSNLKFFIALAVCIAVGIGVIITRMGVEAENKTYDIVLDYNELELLAEQSENDIAWWLNEFHEMGITRVGLQEESLISLMENSPFNVNVEMMDSLIQDSGWRSKYPDEFNAMISAHGFDRFDVLVDITGKEAIDFVLPAIQARLHDDVYYYYMCDNGEKLYMMLDGDVEATLYLSTFPYIDNIGAGFTMRNQIVGSKLMYLSIGLMPEKVEMIHSFGMDVIPRTMCYKDYNDVQYANAVLDGYAQYNIVPEYIITGGEAVLGWNGDDDDDDENDEDTNDNTIAQDYMSANNITLGLVENSSQRENQMVLGAQHISEKTGYNTVRIFSVWDYIQSRYAYFGYEGAEEIENTLYRAVVERNIRIIYFKPIKQTDSAFAYMTEIEDYREMFENLDERLADHGITRDRASVMNNMQIHPVVMVFLILGASISCALLPSTFLNIKKKWTLLMAAGMTVGQVLLWLIIPEEFALFPGFFCAISFACLAAAYMLAKTKAIPKKVSEDTPIKRILPYAILTLIISVLIALVGAMMTTAPMSSAPYMLEFSSFRGVKIAQLIPLAYFCVLFVAFYGIFEKDRTTNTLQLSDIVRVMRWNIPVWTIALLGAVGLVGTYYLARTGHETNASISLYELIMRNALEKALLARPRTKEFLIAFPSIMLAVYSAVRRMPLFTAAFGLVGTIGLTSVCNTFMHIRTPLYLSFLRTLYAVILGIIIGVILMYLFELVCRIGKRLYDKYLKAELSK